MFFSRNVVMTSAVVVALFLFGSVSAHAQATSGAATVAGTVTDQTGAVIPGAQVTLTDEERGVERTAQTNAAGLYVFPDVPPGVYDLRAQNEGFQVYELTGLRVEVGQRATVTIEMQVGQVGTVVTVEAGAVQLETESNAIGTVVDKERVDELPLNGRNFLQLAVLAGGSYNATGRSQNPQTGHPGRWVVISGTKPAYNSYMINGIQVRGARLGELAVNLSPANIDQFKVQQSFFMPDQGPNPAIVSVNTRGGTNEFHGQLFEFLRNTELDARNFFSPGPEELKRNQFGAAVGGPIVHNRLFFYAGYEGLRERQAFTQNVFTPTQRMFGGDFEEVGQPIYDPMTFDGSGRSPFPNNIIPESRINSTSRTLLQYYRPGSSLQQRPNNLATNPRDTLDDDQWNARIDWRINDAQSLFGQFISSDSPAVQPGPFPLSGAFYPNEMQLGMVQHTWTVSPTLVNTFRVGASRNVALFSNEARTEGNLLRPLGIVNTFDVRGITRQNMQGFTGFGRSNGDLGNLDNNYQLDEGVTLITGSHQFRFGASIRYRRTWQQNANAGAHGGLNYQRHYTAQLTTDDRGRLVPGGNSGSSFADYLLGLPVQGGTRGLPMLPYRFTQYMPYIQDTWKVRRNFTVNWGLSWFKDTIPDPQGFARDFPHGFDPQSGLLEFAVLGEIDPKVIQPDNNNFAPRLGFAWQVAPKTVVRGGGGVYYSDQQLIELQFAAVGPPFTRSNDLIVDRFNPMPEFILGQNIYPQAPLPEIDQDFARNLPPGEAPFLLNEEGTTPYVSQWNFSVQHELTNNDLVELVYMGNSAHNQQNRYDFNQCRVGADLSCDRSTRPYLQYRSLLRADFNGNSSYNAVIGKYHHRVSGGLNLRFEYTYAKGFVDGWESGGATNAQISECRACDKDFASFDARHRAVVSAIWNLPFGRTRQIGANMNRALDYVVGGWTITTITTFQTGTPFLMNQRNTTGSPFVLHRPNRVCGGDLDSVDLRRDFTYFDTSCFVPAATGFFGNNSRSPLHGPGINNWDIGIQKFFPIHEEVRLQFRAEMFNAFNHAQFGNPNGNATNPNFGLVGSARAPRLVQLGLKLLF